MHISSACNIHSKTCVCGSEMLSGEKLTAKSALLQIISWLTLIRSYTVSYTMLSIIQVISNLFAVIFTAILRHSCSQSLNGCHNCFRPVSPLPALRAAGTPGDSCNRSNIHPLVNYKLKPVSPPRRCNY